MYVYNELKVNFIKIKKIKTKNHKNQIKIYPYICQKKSNEKKKTDR